MRIGLNLSYCTILLICSTSAWAANTFPAQMEQTLNPGQIKVPFQKGQNEVPVDINGIAAYRGEITGGHAPLVAEQKAIFFSELINLCEARKSKIKITHDGDGNPWMEPVDPEVKKITDAWFAWDGQNFGSVDSIRGDLITISPDCEKKAFDILLMGRFYGRVAFASTQECKEAVANFESKVHPPRDPRQSPESAPVFSFQGKPLGQTITARALQDFLKYLKSAVTQKPPSFSGTSTKQWSPTQTQHGVPLAPKPEDLDD